MDNLKRKSSKSRNTSPGSNDDKVVCEIILLDPSQSNYIVTANIHDDGSVLFDNVCVQLGGILEKDYFGLRYLDKHGQRQWLELSKPLNKQIKDKNNQKATQMFSFRFKHYPKYPVEDLKQDLSRYLLYLQLRRDLYRGRLVGNSSQQYHMAALILQAETGEFDITNIENAIKISDLKILPHINRKSEMRILGVHETLKELETKEAEKMFLEEASKLQTYGVEPIPVKDQKGNELFVGIVEEGISTFNGSKRAHTFPWQNILKLSYSHKMFMFQVYMDQRKHILGFKCESTYAACALWKWALDRKYFFTLDKGSQARRSRSGGSLFRRKKVHTFSGMSQKELTRSCENLQIIPQPHVARAQSMMTLMRSISSRNESSIYNDSNIPNGIDSGDKGYSTLPRSHGLKPFYSESNEDFENASRKNEKPTTHKQKSSSAAIGAVLDFMSALKETPVLHRSQPSNGFCDLPNMVEDPAAVDSDKEETDSNVVSEMIDIADEQRDSMSYSEPISASISKPLNNVNHDQITKSKNFKDSNISVSFVMISIIILCLSVIYGFGIIFRVNSVDHSHNDLVEPSQMRSMIGWLSDILKTFIFKEKENKEK